MATAETKPQQSAGTTGHSPWPAVYILCLGMLMVVLDNSIVNVALPAIQKDLGFSQSNLAWVVNAYLIPFGGLLLLSGRLGDLIGGKKMFLGGMALFTIASALCAAATSEGLLIGARFLQGIGGAMGSAVILGMIVRMFSTPQDQAKAIGIYSFTAAAGGSIGLVAGGVLTDLLSWHWIFLVNLPIGVATVLLGTRMVRGEAGLGLSKGADVIGSALITVALMLGVYTIVNVPDNGWGATETLVQGAIAIALIVAFVVRERTAANPMMPLGLFRSRNTSGTNLVQMLAVAGLFGMFFLGVLYLQNLQGYTPLEVGIAFLPAPLFISVFSLGLAEKLITRFGSKPLLILGVTSLGAGLLVFAFVPADATYVTNILPAVVLIGLGAGLMFPSLITLAMSDVPPDQAGLASGVVNTSLQVGGALGLSVLATFSATRSEHLAASGVSKAEALLGGYHLAFGISVGFLAAAALLAATVLTKARAGAAAVDEELVEAEAATLGAEDA